MRRAETWHLYGSGTPARAAYLELLREQSTARANSTAALARRHLTDAKTWLLLGAGPEPTTEAEVLQGDACVVYVHDLDAGAARESVRWLEAHHQTGFIPVHVDFESIVRTNFSFASRWSRSILWSTRVDVVTILGYTYANVSAEARACLLVHLPTDKLLLDLPLADVTRDPRVLGELTVADERWLKAAAASAFGVEQYNGRLWHEVTYRGTRSSAEDDYEVQLHVRLSGLKDVLLLSWTRKSLAKWLREFESGGWHAVAVEVTRDDGHPLARAAVLLERTP